MEDYRVRGCEEPAEKNWVSDTVDGKGKTKTTPLVDATPKGRKAGSERQRP